MLNELSSIFCISFEEKEVSELHQQKYCEWMNLHSGGKLRQGKMYLKSRPSKFCNSLRRILGVLMRHVQPQPVKGPVPIDLSEWKATFPVPHLHQELLPKDLRRILRRGRSPLRPWNQPKIATGPWNWSMFAEKSKGSEVTTYTNAKLHIEGLIHKSRANFNHPLTRQYRVMENSIHCESGGTKICTAYHICLESSSFVRICVEIVYN